MQHQNLFCRIFSRSASPAAKLLCINHISPDLFVHPASWISNEQVHNRQDGSSMLIGMRGADYCFGQSKAARASGSRSDGNPEHVQPV